MRLGKLFMGLAVLMAASAFTPPKAGASIINFDSRKRGEIISGQYGNYLGGVRVSATNADPNGPDAAGIFITYRNFDSPDPDLRPPYDTGNLSGRGPYPDRVLIIPENVRDVGGGRNGGPNGLIDFPNDESQGGTLTFSFEQQQRALGFDVIDAEGITRAKANGFDVRFFQDQRLLAQVTFSRFINSSSQYHDSTIRFGDNSINRIEPIRAEQLAAGVTSFNRVEFGLGGSAALDRLDFTPAAIPEPGTAALALLGLGGVHLATARSRRGRHPA